MDLLAETRFTLTIVRVAKTDNHMSFNSVSPSCHVDTHTSAGNPVTLIYVLDMTNFQCACKLRVVDFTGQTLSCVMQWQLPFSGKNPMISGATHMPYVFLSTSIIQKKIALLNTDSRMHEQFR